jgi:hypothetical protein
MTNKDRIALGRSFFREGRRYVAMPVDLTGRGYYTGGIYFEGDPWAWPAGSVSEATGTPFGPGISSHDLAQVEESCLRWSLARIPGMTADEYDRIKQSVLEAIRLAGHGVMGGSQSETAGRGVTMNKSKKPVACILVRPGVSRPEVVSVEGEDVIDYLAAIIGSPVEMAPYPRQYGPRQGLLLLLDEEGVYRPSAYNRWGVVGPFIVTKEDRRGRQVSLTDEDIQAVLADLADGDGGYLDPASSVENPFREAFARHGIPPSGSVPQAGCWFR